MATSKYRNKKTVCGGITFDSMAEAKRYEYLSLLERSGHISGLTMQVRFELIPKQVGTFFLDDEIPVVVKERACHYIADFQYRQGGSTVIEDVKGFKTKDYIIKRKLMLEKHGITIREIK